MVFVDREKIYRSVYSLVLIAMPCLILSGCIHKERKPISFYRLTAYIDINAKKPVLGLERSKNVMIGLGPIHIPEYLDRPQMVIAVTDHQYRLSEDHRWAESLDQNISLALSTDTILVLLFSINE